MSSPGHRTRSAQEEKRYARIRARISQAEQQASEAIHELNFRMSTPYMQNQVQQFLHYQYADWSEKFLVSYRKWNISMVNIFSKRPVPAAVIAFGRILSGPSKEHRAGEARWVDIHAEGQQASKGAGSPIGFNPAESFSCVNLSLSHPWPIGEKDDQQTEACGKETIPGQHQVRNNLFQKIPETLARGMTRHPMAMGALAVTFGAAVAATLPRSHREDRWMGDARDKMKKFLTSHMQVMVEEVKQEMKNAFRNVWQEEKSEAVPMHSLTMSKKGMSHDIDKENEEYVLRNEGDDHGANVRRISGGAGV